MTELTISITLPADIPPEDEGLRQAQRTGFEWAIIKLWEAGHLTTRQAAERLKLTYYDYIELLGARQIPVVREMSEPPELLRALEEIRQAQPGPPPSPE